MARELEETKSKSRWTANDTRLLLLTLVSCFAIGHFTAEYFGVDIDSAETVLEQQVLTQLQMGYLVMVGLAWLSACICIVGDLVLQSIRSNRNEVRNDPTGS